MSIKIIVPREWKSFPDLQLGWELHRIISLRQSQVQTATGVEASFNGVMAVCTEYSFYLWFRKTDDTNIIPDSKYSLISTQFFESPVSPLENIAYSPKYSTNESCSDKEC
ncbi:hypothetical protein MdBV_sIgp2 [Bracoviriform demolitoris]|uniref:Uncharacterized protein I2 n=1 Tax=Microplitis demolitor bracovirus (isolate Webb) TaxID=654919 RepID=YI2_MDBVW|nr:hypothetical protein MdBV_sIgp2 [Bracoviriform demolitoris]Q5EFR0.1 RecName: Full=Uncharacterized protein I2 [Microplitis demolitor bracovirus (isolate Webb)]AAW77934.1 hypothetical protein [Bracoviriform demolitoris]KAG6558514.1 orph-I1 [Microplitis demolitor]